MDVAEIWQRFQKHMEYTDEEMQIFKSDPLKVKMVTQTPEFVKCRVVAEVVESHGCHAKHQVGDRFVMTPGGQLIEDESPRNMCISAISEISKVLPAISERLVNKSDPNFESIDIVQCPDVGLEKGGWGQILMKVYVEKSA
ncbi:hypothetical protein D1BOALGB6SA_4637 [Olavius sp. associated proteobacterium Delta 1]|nr:hypothetical protein D1BOALGB6SA_4637 [Olavius sp. associated proteobacterium Delta 1]